MSLKETEREKNAVFNQECIKKLGLTGRFILTGDLGRIVSQILLQGWLAVKAFAVCRDGGGYRQVKRNGGIGVTGVYRDGQQIFGHDVCIIQGCRCV